MSYARNKTRYKYDYFKQLNKKKGYCCSYCGTRHKQLFFNHTVRRMVCLSCNYYLRT